MTTQMNGCKKLNKHKGISNKAVLFLMVLCVVGREQTGFAQTYRDLPFRQDYARQFMLPDNGSGFGLKQVRCDRDGVIKVLSTKGLLQPAHRQLVKDRSYRPLNDMRIIALERYRGQFVYLSDKAVLSNAWAGKFYVEHNMTDVSHFAMGNKYSFLLAGAGKLTFYKDGKKVWEKTTGYIYPLKLQFDHQLQHFIILTENHIYAFFPKKMILELRYQVSKMTDMALGSNSNTVTIGTDSGFFMLNKQFDQISELNDKLPWPQITCVREINGIRWIGSTHGAFVSNKDGKFDYYASKRWLVDNHVIDITEGPDNSVLILTEKGLSQIYFDRMTLADKAAHFQKIQRMRHIRYGMSSEFNLQEPGQLSSGTLVDTDNDGLWTSMYLAAELFRYAVTKSGDALQNACEAFEGMERLEQINHLEGFPSRTYERRGYAVSNFDSDPQNWRMAQDNHWRWKCTTSSDESCGHFFAYALFAEMVPDPVLKKRAVAQIRRQMNHIIEHNWYLVDWDGKPTRWGKWNPKYVNGLPVQVGDRKLNSILIISFLQTAYHFTGDEIYKQKAYELMNKHGYLENIVRPFSVIGPIDHKLADQWNHSDDEMYFLAYIGLVKYAFTEDLWEKFKTVVKDHWEIERSEKNPLWNFIYAFTTEAETFDRDESVRWLREFPLDLVGWSIKNSHRKDIELLRPNFRGQTASEILPPDERPLHLHNNSSFRIDGVEGGKREYPGYIYLLPYWLGRYIDAIGPGIE